MDSERVMQSQSGFTLLELLIVLAVLGSSFYITSLFYRERSCSDLELSSLRTLSTNLMFARNYALTNQTATMIEITSNASSIRSKILDYASLSACTGAVSTVKDVVINHETRQIFWVNPLQICFTPQGLTSISSNKNFDTNSLCSGNIYRIETKERYDNPRILVLNRSGNWGSLFP
jgi:prepilin-type N-terminal cleavage/methylation domain-containing protein